MKYNEIMEKVEVTDEMRERILANVSDKAAQKDKKIQTFPTWKRMSTLAACVAIMLLCATTLPSIINTNNPTEGDLATTNEIIECEDVDELSQYAGFDINELTGIPFDVVKCSYTWWFDATAQIEYIGDDNVITYRVAESEEDISGDYNEYSQIKEETVHNIKVTIKGKADKAYLAVWTSGRYAYAICSSEGISDTEMMAIIELLLGEQSNT